MTHHTDAERAEFEHWYSSEGKQPEVLTKVGESSIYKDPYTGVAWQAWKSARRAPAVPVPQPEPVAYLWQHCDTGRTRVVMPDMVITADANWIVVGPLYLAAAPRPPVAATVKLPEPFTTLVRKNSWAPNSYEAAPRSNHQEYGRQWADERIPVFTEQQVRDLLAAHGIGKDKA